MGCVFPHYMEERKEDADTSAWHRYSTQPTTATPQMSCSSCVSPKSDHPYRTTLITNTYTVQPRMGRPSMGARRSRSIEEIQPRVHRVQVVHPAVDGSFEQGFQAPRGRWDCGVPCAAAVRCLFSFCSFPTFCTHCSFPFTVPLPLGDLLLAGDWY